MGGAGSGNFGHSGRPDEVGGSGAGGEKSYYYKTVHEKCEIATDLPMTGDICKFADKLNERAANEGGVAAQEKESLNLWKGTGYLTIDHLLRDTAEKDSQGHYKDPYPIYPIDKERTQHEIDALDRVMSESKIEKDITVYRGISVRAGHRLDVDGEFKNPSYTATSAKLGAAMGFAQFNPTESEQNVMMINVPKGSDGYYFGTKDDEAEVLLPRDLSLKVTGVTTYAAGIHEKVTTPYVDHGGENNFEGPVTVYTMEIQK